MNEVEQLDEYIHMIMHFFKNQISSVKNMYSQEQFSIIMICLKNNNVTASMLAQKLNVTLPAILHKLTSLEEKGIIYKENDLNDKRIKYIKITNETLNTCQKFKEERYNNIESYLNYLGCEDTKCLMRLLDKTKKYIKEEK